MRSRSRRARRFVALALVGAVVVPLPRLVPTLAQATTVIIQDGTVQEEDLYAFGSRVLIEGVVEGDLVVAARSVVVSGRVDGDVTGVVWDDVVVTGEVAGSVRVAARNVDVAGRVGDDLAALAWSVDVAGAVGRDVIASTGGLGVAGSVGRDVRGQMGSLRVAGEVNRSLEVAVRSLALGAGARVGGDVSYRSHAEAGVAPDAEVAGQFFRREPRAQLWTRAFRRATGLLSFYGFVVAGIAAAWVFRRSWPAAVQAVAARPWRSLAVGLGFMVLAPPAAVLLGSSVVGLPLALGIAAVWLAAFVLGPVPALAAAGRRLVRGRGGALGGFLAAAVVWRLAIWLLPAGGAILYLGVVAWGAGGWLLGARRVRAELPGPEDDPFALPPPAPEPVPAGWQPPLAPAPAADGDPAARPGLGDDG